MIANHFGYAVKTNGRLTRLEEQYKLFWAVIQPHLANIIHSPVHTRRDELVEKLVTENINEQELSELNRLLKECISNCETDGKKIAATLLLSRAEVLHKYRKKRKWIHL